jgi:hypothetical protein
MGPGDFSSSIPTGADNLPSHELAEPNLQSNGTWQLASEDWNMPGFSRSVAEDTYQDSVEGGLYWLWDMTWNGDER